MTNNWIYDAIIYIYALSLLFYFSDFAGTNRSAKRIGTGLLIFVWVLQTLFFIVRMIQHRYLPVLTLFEIMFFFSWLLVTVSLVVSRFFRVELLVFFVNVVSFAMLVLNMFGNPMSPSPLHNWEIAREMLFIHIALAVCSYVFFTIGAIFSGMYLFLHRKLKEKQWSATMRRFPSLEKIESYSYMSVISGVPLLFMAVALAVVSVSLEGKWMFLLDPKVFMSFVALGAYIVYLIRRKRAGDTGRRLALMNLLAFAFVVINFVLSNSFSSFHQWIWK